MRYSHGPWPQLLAGLQGDCPQEPPPALAPSPPRTNGKQCVLAIFEDFIELAQPTLWISDLYMNLVGGTTKDHATLVGIHFADAKLWMTDCMLRGDGFQARAVDIRDQRKLYARGALRPSMLALCLLRATLHHGPGRS